MALASGFLTSSLGTVTVRTPFSIEALTRSTFAFSGSLNLLKNFPLLLSTRCHVSFLSSFSTFLSPLIWRTLSSSISILTSSFLSPGRSALNTWASGVSFQSIRVFAKAEFSRENSGNEDERGT
ncbi:Proline transporter 1 [Quillaja saponaria]|uniref:Proline transporter 1 n=1 Tax=Quillaja saponaria TaxID=32244 RepID=A0AAD7KWB8_QUISA|nr:Proline transporter 1 [Quillaja saponaria]